MLKIALFIGLGLMLLFRGLRSPFYLLYFGALLGVCYCLEQFYSPHLRAVYDYSLYAVLFCHIVLINLATFFCYWYDKRAAKRQKYRIPERTLHAMAMVGGTPFALLGRLVFRHKTKKVSFRIDFWLIAAGQVALLYYIVVYHFLR